MNVFGNIKLGKKIILLTVFGVFLGMGIFSFLGVKAVNQATEVTLEDRMTTAGLVANYMDKAMGWALDELHHMAIIADVENSALREDWISELKDNYGRMSIDVDSVYLIDNTGEIIFSEPSGAEGGNIGFYPDVISALNTRQPQISSLVISPVDGDPVIFITDCCNVSDPESLTIAVAIALDKSGISGLIQPVQLGQTGYVEIIDRNGIVIARTEPGSELAPFTKSDHSERFAALIAEGKPTRGLCHTCHEPVQKVERRDVLAFVPLTITSWGVVIRQSESEALAPVNRLRTNLLLTGSGFLLIIFVLAFVSTRNVVRRIQLLTEAARRIEKRDLSSPVLLPGNDEIGVLASTFEQMRTNLKQSYEALEQKTRELTSLLSVSEILNQPHDLSNPDSVLIQALDRTLEILKIKFGGIMLIKEGSEGEVLYYRVYRGFSTKYADNYFCRLGEGVPGTAAQTGEGVVVRDKDWDERFGQSALDVSEGIKVLISVPLIVQNKIIGVLNVASSEAREFSPENIHLLDGIAGQLAIAIENARLHRELQDKEEIRGELLKSIYSIQEEERKRIARELHDETSQILTSLNANLEAASSILPEAETEVKEVVRGAQALSINILDGIHKLIYDLRPSLLDDLGLVSAIRWLVENKLENMGIRVELKTTGRNKRLPQLIEITLFRVIQEAVSNIAKHSRAKNVFIGLYFKKHLVQVEVRDDGRGFDLDKVINAKDWLRGLGLLGMKERIELVKGTLTINSHLKGGTQVTILIPIGGGEK